MISESFYGKNHGLLALDIPDFGATLKNYKKSKLDRNELKLSTQHKDMYMYQEKI